MKVRGLLAALLVLATAGCAGEQVPMPPDDASPTEVATAYVQALAAKDCDTAHALRLSGDGGWCGKVTVSDYSVKDPVPDGPGGVSEQYRQGVYVPVEFTTRGGDISLPDGRRTWGYVMVRDSDTEPWRIADEGVG